MKHLPAHSSTTRSFDVEMHAPDFEKIARKLANLPTIEGLLNERDPNELKDGDLEYAQRVVEHLLLADPKGEDEILTVLKRAQKTYRRVASKSLLLAGYRATIRSGHERHAFLEDYLISKGPRSQSGVLVVTVFTSPYPEVDGVAQAFSCKWNCYYCPNEPNQPRSYLLNEPGVRRANRLEFDPIRQFTDRVDALVSIGHPADKVELLVLGGTWESYPEVYRERFIRDLYYAANTYFEKKRRVPMSLLDEQTMNESAECKLIGLTLETRPDTINRDMLVKLRQLGCTRVQIGVQHTNDSILRTVNREATRSDTVRAIRLLKDSCFKVDIHLMPDLPGSTPGLDKEMFDDVLQSPDLQADQWKIYPCQTTPFTLIKQWYEEGKYASYGLTELIEVILYAKRKVHPWIRLNRVIRDIPVEYVLEGVEVSNLRQLLQQRMTAEGQPCQCIRCREVKSDKDAMAQAKEAVLVRRTYESSRGRETFLSYETANHCTLFGFLRLRFAGPASETPFTELKDCALIRELHVYGNLAVAKTGTSVAAPLSRLTPGETVQHLGFGTRLLAAAEQEASTQGYARIAVISGVGVRNFYRKRGYEVFNAHEGGFMFKTLENFETDPLVRRHRIATTDIRVRLITLFVLMLALLATRM
jgi:ELP3 family radical SAM enzyme/protein acetyltransferase